MVDSLSSPFGPSRVERRTEVLSLLWPLLTSRSASSTTHAASSFRRSGEISPDKTIDCPCTSAGSTRHPFGRESFAVSCPLALVSPASYPIPVRRPTGPATPLLSACLSRFPPCGSLGSLRPTPQRTSTSWSMFMLGIQQEGRPSIAQAAKGVPRTPSLELYVLPNSGGQISCQ